MNIMITNDNDKLLRKNIGVGQIKNSMWSSSESVTFIKNLFAMEKFEISKSASMEKMKY